MRLPKKLTCVDFELTVNQFVLNLLHDSTKIKVRAVVSLNNQSNSRVYFNRTRAIIHRENACTRDYVVMRVCCFYLVQIGFALGGCYCFVVFDHSEY
jgi:hypothetical protein